MCGHALQLLAEPKRREILRLIWTEERSAGDIARHFTTTFGAVSQHLSRLGAAGLIRRRRTGRRHYYIANRAAFGPLAVALEAMWSEQLDTLRRMAEQRQIRLDSKRVRRRKRRSTE